jgi:dimethylaniline monooxygenase (N-oxide forming)
MPSLPTAAVIGAGSSGIAAAKALHERGVPFTCFEASDRVGGNWVFANKNGMSAAYRQLLINTSRDRMEYSDYPMPKSNPDFPHHTQIAAYFDAYVEHFGFRDRIRFETKVARARRLTGGGWELTLDDGSVERFAALLVANGHHWDPRWPEPAFPGHETFTGQQLHAHAYVDNDLFAGKDVVVLGMGNSAMDIAVESSYVARTTYLAARRGAWIIPKYMFGRPVDQLPQDPRKDIEDETAAMRKRYVASKRHTIQVDFDDYLHALGKERRAGAERARRQGFALPVAPGAARAMVAAPRPAPTAGTGSPGWGTPWA